MISCPLDIPDPQRPPRFYAFTPHTPVTLDIQASDEKGELINTTVLLMTGDRLELDVKQLKEANEVLDAVREEFMREYPDPYYRMLTKLIVLEIRKELKEVLGD